MPSILDSAKLVFTDSNAPAKILVHSLTPFIIYNITNGTFSFSESLNLPIIATLSIIYLGYMFQTLNNSMQEKNYILSGLNPFLSFWVGIKSIISCGIFVVPIYYVYRLVSDNLDMTQIGSWILGIIALLVAGSFLFCSIIFFGKRCNIFDGWNLIKILKNFHEIIVYLALSLILLIIYDLVTAVPFGGLIYGLFGFGRLFEYAISVIITSNLLIYFQNLSHAYFEQVKE